MARMLVMVRMASFSRQNRAMYKPQVEPTFRVPLISRER